MKKIGEYWLPDADEHFVPHFQNGNGFQLERLDIALQYVTDFSIAIDGGAHVGSWTRTMLDRFKLIHAFEPAPDTYACLARNVWAYTQLGKVIVHNAALGDKNMVVDMACDAKYIAQKNTGARYVVEGSEVPMVKIDDLDLPSLGFLKLDVEGAEYLALKGAEQTIRKYKPVVFIEVKKSFGQRFGLEDAAPINFLKELGAVEVDRIKADHIFAFKNIKEETGGNDNGC